MKKKKLNKKLVLKKSVISQLNTHQIKGGGTANCPTSAGGFCDGPNSRICGPTGGTLGTGCSIGCPIN